MIKPFTFDDISEMPSERDLPRLDRSFINTFDLTPDQHFWREHGILILKNFIPTKLIESYCKLWERENIQIGDNHLTTCRNGGFLDCTPYLRHPEIKDLGLYPPLMKKLEELIGEPMGMHLNLTGWKSTQRNFHQDDYLNPPFVKTWYAAVWIALDEIHPNSGPFEFVPGSHKWPLTTREKLFAHIPKEWHSRNDWPKLTEDVVSEAFEKEITKRNAPVEKFLALQGDVLIWHGRLAHRGSLPKDQFLMRKAFISHYSGISHRPDMPEIKEHTPGCYYFNFKERSNGYI